MKKIMKVILITAVILAVLGAGLFLYIRSRFPTAGDTEIEIIENPHAEISGNENLSIGFHAENLDSLRETLIADGLAPSPMISPMPNVRFFFVKDPAGVTVQFM